MSLRVHIEAAARGGISSTKSLKKTILKNKKLQVFYLVPTKPDGRFQVPCIMLCIFVKPTSLQIITNSMIVNIFENAPVNKDNDL